MIITQETPQYLKGSQLLLVLLGQTVPQFVVLLVQLAEGIIHHQLLLGLKLVLKVLHFLFNKLITNCLSMFITKK